MPCTVRSSCKSNTIYLQICKDRNVCGPGNRRLSITDCFMPTSICRFPAPSSDFQLLIVANTSRSLLIIPLLPLFPQNSHTYKQTEKQTVRQTVWKQADRQTDRQTERKTERWTENSLYTVTVRSSQRYWRDTNLHCCGKSRAFNHSAT